MSDVTTTRDPRTDPQKGDVICRLLELLPVFDPQWTPQQQDAWFNACQGIVDLSSMEQHKTTSAREILRRRVYDGNEDRICEREETRREMETKIAKESLTVQPLRIPE